MICICTAFVQENTPEITDLSLELPVVTLITHSLLQNQNKACLKMYWQSKSVQHIKNNIRYD